MTDPKRYRAIIATSHIDGHGDMLSKEALEKMVDSINCSDKMIRVGVDHRRDFPPRGRLENAELKEKAGDFYVEADFVEFEKTEIVEWNNNYLIQSFDNVFQFAEVDEEESNENSISIDPNNFNSAIEAKNFSESLKANPDFKPKINYHGRKAQIPDPEIIYQFAKAAILYQIVKPTAKKMGEKLADAIANKAEHQVKALAKFIEKSLKELFYRCVPKKRPVTIVFNLPGKPHIELLARTRDEKLVLKGLRSKKLKTIREEIESINKNIKIAKVQFILNDKGNWNFNYLITHKGQTIGTKEILQKREHLMDIISSKKLKTRR